MLKPHSSTVYFTYPDTEPAHRYVVQKEEFDLEKLREKERIRSGKELGQAKKMEEGLQLQRNLESRRIEKEEERRARDKIKVKLGEWGEKNLTCN